MWCQYQNQEKTLPYKLSSYLPLALTICVCKIMERMINNRLVWYGLVPGKKQTYHSHTEWLPQRTKHHRPACTLGVLCLRGFYSEATWDRYFLWSWKGIQYNLEVFGILKDLHAAGVRGQLPLFVDGFLQNRKFQVRVGGSYSKLFEQETGVPQWSILSVTLFCLKIN